MAFRYVLLLVCCLVAFTRSTPVNNNAAKKGKIHPQTLHKFQDPDSSSIVVALNDTVFEVSEQFLSVTIDAYIIRSNWDRIINFTAPKVLNMAKALHPAMLRVGGTSEDFIIFENGQSQAGVNLSNYTMNTTQWDAVNKFVQAVGWDFIFGLNILLRKPWPNGTWDSSNAEELMSYTHSKGYQVNWELGNGIWYMEWYS